MYDLSTLLQLINDIRTNPSKILGSFGIPENLFNDPRGMVQHLLNSGQRSQEQLNEAMKMRDNPLFRNLFK